MDAERNKILQKHKNLNFKERSDDEKRKLLTEKDKKNTQAATDRAILHLKNFLTVKSLPKLEDLDATQLNEILLDYYCSVQPLKNTDDVDEKYSIQTLKCMRAALNRHFRKENGIDIVKDQDFIRSNEMFKAVCVESKKAGKGVKRSYPPISPVDLERIAEYFCHDHVNKPDPRRLQQNLIFYVIYFFCRRGRENLYTMTRDTFEIIIEPDGTEYVIQKSDEIDKNHGIEDTEKTKQGRMYATKCKYPFI